MNNLIITSLFIIFLSSCVINEEKDYIKVIERYDNNKTKKAEFYSDDMLEIKIRETSYYSNQKIKSTSEYANGQQTGEWSFFMEDGSMKSRGNYLNGLLNDTVYFYDHGTLTRKHFYRNDTLLLNEDYFNNGQISLQYFVNNNVQTGTWKQWYSNGQIKCISSTEFGSHQEFYDNGKPSVLGKFSGWGKKDSTWLYWNKEEVLLKKVRWEDGVRLDSTLFR